MRKRNIRIWARVSEAENEIITNRIKKTGLSREAYIRCLLLGVVPKEKPDAVFYTVMRELSAIGNNIHQIARKAAALGFIDVPFYKREAEQWSAFRMAVKRKFLEPEKLEPPDGRY